MVNTPCRYWRVRNRGPVQGLKKVKTIEFYQAFDRATDKLVHDEIFDPERHSLDPIPPAKIFASGNLRTKKVTCYQNQCNVECSTPEVAVEPGQEIDAGEAWIGGFIQWGKKEPWIVVVIVDSLGDGGTELQNSSDGIQWETVGQNPSDDEPDVCYNNQIVKQPEQPIETVDAADAEPEQLVQTVTDAADAEPEQPGEDLEAEVVAQAEKENNDAENEHRNDAEAEKENNDAENEHRDQEDAAEGPVHPNAENNDAEKDSVGTLTHSSSSFTFGTGILQDGVTCWHDRSYTYHNVPEELQGIVFFPGPHKAINSGTLTFTPVRAGTVYIWSEACGDNRHGGISSLGWDALGLNLTWLHESTHNCMPIYKYASAAGEAVNIAITTEWVGGVGFKEPAFQALWVEFSPTKLRDGSANSVQISEILFRFNGVVVDMASALATNPGGSSPEHEGPEKSIDGSSSTKWLDFNKGPLRIKFSELTSLDAFSFITANDGEDRDPVQWVVRTSCDGNTWFIVQQQDTDFSTPLERRTSTPWMPLSDPQQACGSSCNGCDETIVQTKLEDGSDDPVDVCVWAVLAGLRAFFIFAVAIAGIVLTCNLSGSRYYRLDKDVDVSAFAPQCLAIIYPFDENSAKLDLGTVGQGEELQSWGSLHAPIELQLEASKGEGVVLDAYMINASLYNASSLEVEQCSVMFVTIPYGVATTTTAATTTTTTTASTWSILHSGKMCANYQWVSGGSLPTVSEESVTALSCGGNASADSRCNPDIVFLRNTAPLHDCYCATDDCASTVNTTSYDVWERVPIHLTAITASSRYWRVMNADVTAWRPAVAEVSWYGDAGCTDLLTTGQVPQTLEDVGSLCAGYDMQGSWSSKGCHLAYDGSSSTEWRPSCHPCAPRAAWIGVAFSVPTTVMCVTASNLGVGSGGSDTWDGGLVLQQSADGQSWVDVIVQEANNTVVVAETFLRIPEQYCNSHPGGLLTGYTLATCQAACAADSSCQGFDYTSSNWGGTPWCVLIPSAFDCSILSHSNWDHYVKEMTTTTTTMTATSAARRLASPRRRSGGGGRRSGGGGGGSSRSRSAGTYISGARRRSSNGGSIGWRFDGDYSSRRRRRQEYAHNRVLLLNGLNGAPISMGLTCGGDNPGAWLESTTTSGKWANALPPFSIIWGLLAWLCMKWLSIGMEYATMKGLNSDASSKQKIMFSVLIFLLFSWCISCLLAPIQNLQCSELCPQLVTTNFPAATHDVFAYLAVFMCFEVMYVAYYMYKIHEEENAMIFFVNFIFTMFVDGVREIGEGVTEGVGKFIDGVIKLGLCVAPIVFIVMTGMYNFALIYNVSFWVLLGLKFDLSLRYPKFSLAIEINWFHVLTFVVWMLDTLNLCKLIWMKIIKPYIKPYVMPQLEKMQGGEQSNIIWNPWRIRRDTE